MPYQLDQGTKIQLKTKITPNQDIVISEAEQETLSFKIVTTEGYVPLAEAQTFSIVIKSETTEEEAIVEVTIDVNGTTSTVGTFTTEFTDEFDIFVSESTPLTNYMELQVNTDAGWTADFEHPFELKGTKKVTHSAVELSDIQLSAGEPLFDTNTNRLHIGGEVSYTEDDIDVTDSTVNDKQMFLPAQGKNDEYHIRTVYNDDGTNDGISFETSKLDATIPDIDISSDNINISKNVSTPLVNIESADNKTTIYTDVDIKKDLQLDGDLNITGIGVGKVSFTNSGTIFVGDYDISTLHAGIRLREGIENNGPCVDIQAKKQDGEGVSDANINLQSDNINIQGDTAITGSLKTKLDPMITTGENQPWYELVGQANGSITRDLKYHGNVGLQHVNAAQVNFKLPELNIPDETNKYVLGSDTSYFKHIHSYGYDIYDDTSESLVDLKDYIDDAISGVVNKVTVKTVPFDFEATSENVLSTLSDGVNIGDVGIIKKPIDSAITSISALTSYTGNYQYTCYVWNGTAWAAADGNYSAANVFLSKDMIITESFGKHKVTSGSQTPYHKGDSLEFILTDAFSKSSYGSVSSPYINITSGSSNSSEVGTTATVPKVKATVGSVGSYQYGPATGIKFSGTVVDGSTDSNKVEFSNLESGDSSGELEHSEKSITYTDSTIIRKFVLNWSHTEGTEARTNLQGYHASNAGNSGYKIPANSGSDTTTAVFTYTGYRKSFWGVSTNATSITTSTAASTIKNLGSSGQSKPSNISVAKGSRQVTIAVPEGSANSLSVKDGLAQDAIVTFTGPVTVSVNLNSSGTTVAAKNYKVWYVDWGSGIDSAKELKLTWG